MRAKTQVAETRQDNKLSKRGENENTDRKTDDGTGNLVTYKSIKSHARHIMHKRSTSRLIATTWM